MTASDRSPTNQIVSTNPIDIQRLFEDRAFEGELLRFISQRMDPPPPGNQPPGPPRSPSDDQEDVPTYRPL